MKPAAAVHSIQSLLELLESGAEKDYIGEPVSQLQHALQAAQHAVNAGADETLILAALFHDVGHSCDPAAEQMPGLGALDHETLGAEHLRRCGLSDNVASPVSLHVAAKRYLATTTPGYLEKLSQASEQTLSFQGGPMSEAECRAFEGLPLFRQALQLRAWDEAAKDPGAVVQPLKSYVPMIKRNLSQPISEAQVLAFRETGFLHLKAWFSPDEMTSILTSTDDLQHRPETAGKWMQYFEVNEGTRQLCRIENFLDFESRFDVICRGDATIRLLSLLMDEPARLFKEKINFKLPGGQGFAPHQDAPAFTSFNQTFHITMMLSLDESRVDNGCLEIAEVSERSSLLPMNDDLTIAEDTASSLQWRPVPTEPGDLLLFDSYLPHRSGVNQSREPRRALYATYNRLSDGDVRNEYFARKREAFPPDVERQPGVRYDGGVFNVGNPVSQETLS